MDNNSRKTRKTTRVTVQESPVAKINRHGNLTGNVRLLRDHIVEIYDLIQMWNEKCASGVRIINDITDMILERSNTSGFSEFHEKIQKPFDQLSTVCDQMEKVVHNMELHQKAIAAVVELEEMKDRNNILFLTWPRSKFSDVSKQIYEMFKKELSLKCKVKQCLNPSLYRHTLCLYSAYWLYQPYIDDGILDSFVAMIKETSVTK